MWPGCFLELPLHPLQTGQAKHMVRGYLLCSGIESSLPLGTHSQTGTHGFQVLVGSLNVLHWVGTQKTASTDLLCVPPYLILQLCQWRGTGTQTLAVWMLA